MEATTVVQWCTLAEIEMLGGMDQSSKQQLQAINDAYSNNRNNEQFDPDAFMVWAKSRHMLGRTVEVYNIINQVCYGLRCVDGAEEWVVLKVDAPLCTAIS
jgi:hypothetical protein